MDLCSQTLASRQKKIPWSPPMYLCVFLRVSLWLLYATQFIWTLPILWLLLLLLTLKLLRIVSKDLTGAYGTPMLVMLHHYGSQKQNEILKWTITVITFYEFALFGLTTIPPKHVHFTVKPFPNWNITL